MAGPRQSVALLNVHLHLCLGDGIAFGEQNFHCWRNKEGRYFTSILKFKELKNSIFSSLKFMGQRVHTIH